MCGSFFPPLFFSLSFVFFLKKVTGLLLVVPHHVNCNIEEYFGNIEQLCGNLDNVVATEKSVLML